MENGLRTLPEIQMEEESVLAQLSHIQIEIGKLKIRQSELRTKFEQLQLQKKRIIEATGHE